MTGVVSLEKLTSSRSRSASWEGTARVWRTAASPFTAFT